MPTFTLDRGVTTVIHDAAVAGVGILGQIFALHPLARQLSWQTIFSPNPATTSIQMQGSMNGSSWENLDTTTDVTGEIRNVVTSVAFVRFNYNDAAGATLLTLIVRAS